jgi:cytosine/adenosine deaminase-related metal-dependent hydrolase
MTEKRPLRYCLVVWFLLFNFCAFAQETATKADLLIRNTTLIDVVKRQVLFHKNIVIRSGHITAITDTLTKTNAIKMINGAHFISLPGFINTHTHLWQHICKSCYPKESLQTWIKIYNTIHYLTPEQLYQVVLAASDEAILSGITTVSDYASLSFNDYGFSTNAKAMYDAGLGGVLVYNNPSVFLPDSIKLKEIPLLQQQLHHKFAVWMGYGPLSFYPIPQVYSGIVIGQKLHMNFSEHTMENNKEQRDFYDATQTYYNQYKDQLQTGDRQFLQNLLTLKRPSDVDAYEGLVRLKQQLLMTDTLLQSAHDTLYKPLTKEERASLNLVRPARLISPLPLLDYLGGLKDFVSIHSVWPQKEDLDIMIKNNISVSHNPESNLYLSSGIAPIDEYRKSNILVSLGTDGAASNDGINMFSAMREMWNVYKIKLMNIEVSKSIADWDILQSATINGAKALKIDSQTGSLDVGKEADLSLISSDELGMSPIRPEKLISLLIYSGNTRNLKYVISDGKVLVENGQLVKNNEAKLARALTAIAVDVDGKIKSGKIWSEQVGVNAGLLKNYWYQYRSIRSADSVKLIVTNHLRYPIKITIASSGAVFGGGTPAVVSPEVSARFPKDNPAVSFKNQYMLNANESVKIIKKRKKYRYEITTAAGTEVKDTGSGQLLLLVEKK